MGLMGRWLRTMPARMELATDIVMFHGTPERDDVYLMESVQADGRVSVASDEEIDERLGSVSQRLLICGHTHIPRVMESRGRLIVNPGSVGLPAYSDDSPVRHLMETGSPMARYAIVEGFGQDGPSGSSAAEPKLCPPEHSRNHGRTTSTVRPRGRSGMGVPIGLSGCGREELR
jgi:diadenosine tetraphosphatase ApaH/serine/threonine PP2A family protein phosphatase